MRQFTPAVPIPQKLKQKDWSRHSLSYRVRLHSNRNEQTLIPTDFVLDKLISLVANCSKLLCVIHQVTLTLRFALCSHDSIPETRKHFTAGFQLLSRGQTGPAVCFYTHWLVSQCCHFPQDTHCRITWVEFPFRFKILLKKIYFIYYAYSILPAYKPAGQKRAPYLIIQASEPPCGSWESNSAPREEQPVLFWAISPLVYLFFRTLIVVCLYPCLCEGIRSSGIGITDSCEPPCGMLGMEPGSSGRAASALNHWAISPAP